MVSDVNWTGKTILIVEDEEVNRFYFQTAFKNTGAKLIFANNGKIALDIVTENEKIDCTLMDIRLPVMDGFTATRKIREIRKELPIIAQTAYAMTNEREKVFEAGCDDYISKPIRLNVLFETLVKYLGT
jgi:two-component system, cell cycle response regulator DivK